jgi:hypothetical protein
MSLWTWLFGKKKPEIDHLAEFRKRVRDVETDKQKRDRQKREELIRSHNRWRKNPDDETSSGVLNQLRQAEDESSTVPTGPGSHGSDPVPSHDHSDGGGSVNVVRDHDLSPPSSHDHSSHSHSNDSTSYSSHASGSSYDSVSSCDSGGSSSYDSGGSGGGDY